MSDTHAAPAPTPEQKAEAQLAEKHPGKVVPGSVHRAPASSGYGTKLLCTIRTKGEDGLWDGNTRLVATSDVFQVHHTVEVAAALRKQRAKDKRAAAKAEREGAEPDQAALDAAGI